ncbi:hypothetical protein CD932_27525 [Janthinobacterium sp. PC23-8]|nr:hypothetical protein CD932_27525 [Janthinobacterium sp. PC23-8]
MRRNVNGCWNLGYCGMGCPTNAKQSMLVTTIPAALRLGACLLTHARAERFVLRGERIASLQVTALDAAGQAATGIELTLLAKHFVLAGGAINSPARHYTSWAQARQAIDALPYQALLARVVSAHVMKGCAMSDDARLGVCDALGRYRGLANLSVHDGSLFPTAIGANPQLSIYALAARLASSLARELTGKASPGFGADGDAAP